MFFFLITMFFNERYKDDSILLERCSIFNVKAGKKTGLRKMISTSKK